MISLKKAHILARNYTDNPELGRISNPPRKHKYHYQI